MRQAKLVQASWIIQPGQSLTSRPEQNFAHIEVTKYVEPKGWQIVDHNASEGVEPRNVEIALGEGFSMSETSIAVCVNGECVSNVPGSKAMVGNLIVCTGTWESHIVPIVEASNELKRQRRKYDDMAVGLTHSRGVDGVTPIESPSSLEGVSSRTQRDEEAYAIH